MVSLNIRNPVFKEEVRKGFFEVVFISSTLQSLLDGTVCKMNTLPEMDGRREKDCSTNLAELRALGWVRVQLGMPLGEFAYEKKNQE